MASLPTFPLFFLHQADKSEQPQVVVTQWFHCLSPYIEFILGLEVLTLWEHIPDIWLMQHYLRKGKCALTNINNPVSRRTHNSMRLDDTHSYIQCVVSISLIFAMSLFPRWITGPVIIYTFRASFSSNASTEHYFHLVMSAGWLYARKSSPADSWHLIYHSLRTHGGAYLMTYGL